MKRTDIRAGVVYAIKSSYGPPSPIIFLEDGAAGLYARGSYGRSEVRKLEETKTTKAKRGSGFSDATRGYAAVAANGGAGAPAAELVAAMKALDPTAELARFVADERPSSEILRFVIEPSLNQIAGLYAEELAAYEAQREAELAADRRKRAEQDAKTSRASDLIEGFSAYGIRARGAFEGKVELSLDEADKLLALLRDRES